jgi:hypothetical protein
MKKHFGFTRNQVIGRWSIGYEAGTASARVPGGRRLEAIRDPGTGDLLLYSYRTVVASLRRDGAFALTTKTYSRSTSALMSEVRRLLTARGFVKTVEVQNVSTAVPGRWGGFGPAWHATGVDLIPFEVWAQPVTFAGMNLLAAERKARNARDLARAVGPDRPFGERDGLPTSAR